MRIEFAATPGPNVEVRLLEDLSGSEVLCDRVYTADHKGGMWYGVEMGVPIRVAEIFSWVEDCWSPPVIGGRWARFHPYWQERAEKRARRRV